MSHALHGIERHRGRRISESALGLLGLVLVLVAILFAHIAARTRLATLLPVVWFGMLVGGAAIAAAWIGPAPCPA
jgi:hypothetical protein